MSDSGDVPELQELQPIDSEPAPGAPRAMSVQEATLHQMRAGLPPPALNPRAGKEYYRFLLAGVVMLLGCLMPFGPEWEMAGYQTLSGAFYAVIALGMIWAWWGAIHHNRFSGAQLKWVALCLIPFIVQLFNLIGAFDAPAVRDYIAQGRIRTVTGWSDLFAAIKGSVPFLAASAEAQAQASLDVENFFRAFGPGKVVVFVGALLAEIFFMLAVFGGARSASQQKQARQAAAGERRRR